MQDAKTNHKPITNAGDTDCGLGQDREEQEIVDRVVRPTPKECLTETMSLKHELPVTYSSITESCGPEEAEG